MSRQDYQTPPEFLDAVLRRLRTNDFSMDLAATDSNRAAERFYSSEDNALVKSWDQSPYWCWLNPPYADLRPWVQKCAEESARGAHIACLVPASVGANWWRDYVVDHAYILYLNGRITFVGETAPYIKDCALLLYTPFIRSGSATWNWREPIV